MHFPILLQRPAERPQRSYAHYATDNAMPGGDESYVGEHVEFERVLFALPIMFHPAGRHDRPTAQGKSTRPYGQYRGFGQEILRPNG